MKKTKSGKSLSKATKQAATKSAAKAKSKGTILRYGFLKAKVQKVVLPFSASEQPQEIQYHLHLTVEAGDDSKDVAINIGTNDADDLLQYKIVHDFHHDIVKQLQEAAPGSHDLTDAHALPALDYVRSSILEETGRWRLSDPMDGSEQTEPAASLIRLMTDAMHGNNDVYIFGRFYPDGSGIHDIHLNQGSTGRYIHKAGSKTGDRNDIWQDGAILVDRGGGKWSAYFSAFEKQLLPTDDLGNPTADAKPVGS